MTKNILLLLIIVLALSLRIFRIGDFPATLYGDEQAFAWNAYSILKTGADEFGVKFPLQFRSFDDYKAPVGVYLLVPFLHFFGLEILPVRLPVVIFSVITVFFTYKLTEVFLGRKASLISAFLLAVSPWHIHLSRGYFEATISLSFFVTAAWLFLGSKGNFKRQVLAMLFLALTVYTYFTPRIMLIFFIPLILLFTGGKWKKKAGLFVIFLIFVAPMVYATFFGPGMSRFNKLSESASLKVAETVGIYRRTSELSLPWKNILHNKYSVRAKQITDNFLEIISPGFWYISGDSSLRYFNGRMGMMSLPEWPFFLIGSYFLIMKKRKAFLFLVSWIALAALPPALAGKPFAVRSLNILPVPMIIASAGIYYAQARVKNIRHLLAGILPLLYCGSLFFILVTYYFEYPTYAATWWGWENKAAIDYAKDREENYDRIFLSDFYTGLPLAFAVYNKVDPDEYRRALENPIYLADGRKFVVFGKYYIGSLDISGESRIAFIPEKSLYLGRPEEIDTGETIKAPDDGRVIFRVYYR